MSSGSPFGRGLVVPLRFVILMWLVFMVEFFYGLNFSYFGIFPRTTSGLLGILVSPLIHGNIIHLLSNTFPLLFLGTTLFMFYDRIAGRVFFQCYFLTGGLVWLLARPSYHIGASGVIYGLAFFLIFFGFFRREFRAIMISIIIIIFYGGLFYGVLPTQPGVSWESHLLGGIVGISSALNLSKLKRVSS